MRVEQNQTKNRRLLRRRALGEVSATTHVSTEKRAKKRKGSRFVGPARLGDDQKLQLFEALEKNRVGDEMGRQIFVGAVEYQISAFAHRLEHFVAPESEPPGLDAAQEQTLRTIAEKARILSGLLRELPDSAKTQIIQGLATADELARGYDERYLQALEYEIGRLERACIVALGEPKPANSGQEPGPDPAVTREIVAKLAEIFSECFEMQPTADENGPFRASLRVIGKITGLTIGHEPEFLAQVLAADAPGR